MKITLDGVFILGYNETMNKKKQIRQVLLSYYTHTETPLFVNKKIVSADYGLHCHNHFELEYIYSGSAIENINGESHEVGRGTLYVMKPTDFHSIKTITELTVITISFDYQILPKSLLQHFCDQSRSFVFNVDEKEIPLYESLFDLLLQEYKSNGVITEAVLAIVFEKFMRLSKIIEKTSSINNQNIMNVISYLNLHFNENPKIKDIASKSGYSPEYFSTLFKQTTNKTFTQYVIDIKINNAKKLLALNKLPILDISLNCGFGSVSNFNRTFKSIVNMSPSEYRKRLRDGSFSQ